MITGDTKEVGLNGMTSTLSDYDCDDGDLQVCHNMISDGAGLEAINDVEVKFTLPVEMEKCVYVHETTAGKVYLVVGTDADIYAYKESDGQLSGVLIDNIGSELFRNADEYSISSIGNVLVVSIHKGGELDGLHYHRWVNDSGGGRYDYLGQYPPDVDLQFELHDVSTGIQTLNKAVSVTDIDTTYFADRNYLPYYAESVIVQNEVMALVNEAYSTTRKNTWFMHPFLVRYAYRMYDGSYLMASAPVLMNPDDGVNPKICLKYNGSDIANIKLSCVADACKLKVRTLASSVDKENIKKWKDIITHVCVFVTPQILDYSETGSKLRYSIHDNMRGKGIYSQTLARSATIAVNNTYYQPPMEHEREVTLGISGSDDAISWTPNIYAYERDGTFKEWLEQSYQFYLLKEYTIEQAMSLGSTAATCNENDNFTAIDGVNLNNLATFEQLASTSYTNGEVLVPKLLHAYNGRQSMANVSVRAYDTFPMGWLSCFAYGGEYKYKYNYSNAGDNSTVYRQTGYADLIQRATVTVYIEENGEYQTTKLKITKDDEWAAPDQWAGFFFYPNTNAKYAYFTGVIRRYSEDTNEFADKWITLTPHPYMTGAYFYGSYSDWSDTKPTEIDNWEEVGVFEHRNYLYTSEVDNPFVFPASGVEAIGNGEIVAIKEATKAVSEGTAFGTMPLYAFCTDGIWSLAVGDTGLYSAKQPVSRETLLNDDAGCATQIDNSIVFLSDRGLMELSGGSTRLLSGQLRGRNNIRDAASLPSWSDIHDRFGGGAFMDADDFIGFIKKGGRIAFDYERYRLIIYREDESTAYVYDVGTETWATMASRIKSSLEGFPATLLNLKGDDGRTEVGAFSIETTTPTGGGRAFYLTRPLKLGEADTLKTVRRLMERGVRSGDGTKYLALWGSRDMRTWRLVGAVVGSRMPRLSGTPYKYFIVGGWTQFTEEGERISRLTLESASRYKDKIR